MIAEDTDGKMAAMVLEGAGRPLRLKYLSIPEPGGMQVLIKVIACGICRTDLHIVDGELPNPALPLIPGHEIIGTVLSIGKDVTHLHPGDVVGVPWLAYTCGSCLYCISGKENLCDNALFTGYTTNGGFATHCLAWEKYCFRMPAVYANPEGAPLLCAGLIGYRSYRMLPADAKRIAFYGFGAAAHLLVQVAQYEKREVYAFTKPGDKAGQNFAKKCGAVWVGDADTIPPYKMDASIIFAPDGNLVPQALLVTDKGGTVICAGIHMSEIPAFSYQLLWEERSLRSVANLTREDGIQFLQLAPKVPITTTITAFPLEEVNKALDMLRNGKLHGAAVLIMPTNESLVIPH